MKKIIFTAVTTLFLLSISAQTRTYEGAWFSAAYPESFTATGSMQSTTDDENFDSAVFVSPDGDVEFYIFAPQWGGHPTDIGLEKNEKEGDRNETKSKDKIITSWTISANDGSYTRSYQEIKNPKENTVKIIGVKYNNAAAYEKYKNDYLAFKKSVQQFAD